MQSSAISEVGNLFRSLLRNTAEITDYCRSCLVLEDM